MERLRAQGMSLWQGGQPILQQLSFTLHDGERLVIVGPSTLAKDSLLRVLAGELAAEGQLLRAPGSRLQYLPQQASRPLSVTVWQLAQTVLRPLADIEQAVRSEELRLAAGQEDTSRYAALLDSFEALGGYQAEQKLKAHFQLWGVAETQFEQPLSSLSGGEWQRLRLGLVLWTQPDILILDAPSNHLDLPAKRLLAQALTQFRGALIMVSNDRALMDAVGSHVGQLREGLLHITKGTYSSFEQQSQQQRRSLAKAIKERQKTERQLQATLQQLRSWGTESAARQRRQLERRLTPVTAIKPVSEDARRFQLSAVRLQGTLYRAKHLSKTLSGRVLVDDVALQLAAGEKIALVGPNGSGKSTLLKLIAGELESDHPGVKIEWQAGVKLAYVDQEWRGLRPDVAAILQLTAYVTAARARMLLALVGLNPERWQVLPSQLSGEERARLGVAALMAAEKNLLLLDEPTNDLDLQMIELLEDALVTTEATILLVSHDARLIEAVCTQLWSIEAGKIVEYRGGLKGYAKGTRRREEGLVTELPEVDPEEQAKVQSVDELEHERQELEEALLDPLRLTEREQQRLQQRHHEVMNALSEHYDQALPPAAPRYSYTLAGVRVSSDGLSEGMALLSIADTAQLKLRMPASSSVGHLSFVETDNSCLLDWVKPVALRLAARIAFEHLNCRAVQVQQDSDLGSAGFQPATNHWWLLSRNRYEVQEGFQQRKRRRKLRAGS